MANASDSDSEDCRFKSCQADHFVRGFRRLRGIMKHKYIIWDWNGTLLDDVQISIDAMNEMLEQRGYSKRIDYSLYREIFCFPIIEYYKKIGFDFSRHPFDGLAQQFISNYSPKQSNAVLYDDAKKALVLADESGFSQAVISVCERERLFTQINPFGIEGYFTSVLGTQDNYAVSKIDLAKGWLESNAISPNDVVFIGDTNHDFEVAQSVSCDCVLVSTGHQSKQVLKKTGARIFDNVLNAVSYLASL